MMKRWYRRLCYAWRRHGVFGFAALAVYNLFYYACRRNPGRQTDAFDTRFGTNTSSVCDIGALDIAASPSAVHAVRYQPSSADWIIKPIEKLAIEPPRFTFIDFGSGKGRALLAAAGFPFKEVIGVEFSRELHETAVQNIARFPRSAVRAAMLRSVCSDAAVFELPESDLLCYFYNPFGPAVMRQVAARLIAHHRQGGYEVVVIYADPRHRDMFDRTGQFVAVAETGDVLVLRAGSEADRELMV